MNALELPFTQLGRYEVLAPIAEGGMATVYAGRSLDARGRAVAIKVIRAEHSRNKDFVAMFLDEARIASQLSHPNVVDIVEFGHDGARYFLAMDLVLGQTLGKISDACRARKITLAYGVVAWIGARIAEGLHYAHELRDSAGKPVDVVHRDINPSNILVTYDGVPKVIDFGLARAADRITSTAKGIVKGKLAYLSPEQVQGQPADRRADIFALGITLWEVSVGRRLFKAEDDVGTIQRLVSADVPDPTTIAPDYPPALAKTILHALVRDPNARYATAGELARDLDACAFENGKPVGQREVAAIMATLFPDDGGRPLWERAARVGAKQEALLKTVRNESADDQIQAWDDDAQKMTWMHVEEGSAPPMDPPPQTDLESLRAAFARREPALADDARAGARLAIERALVEETLGDRAAAIAYAERALALEPSFGVAHWALRRLSHSRDNAAALVPHLDAEIAAGGSEGARADLLAERARLLDASRAPDADVCTAWERALATRPGHPAALTGLEAAYARREDDGGARKRVNHLERMAEAYADEPKLAAWLHVERAEILDRTLHEVDAAWGALGTALALDPGLGPVRDACVHHTAIHRDAAAFVALLEAESQLEPDPVRAASLEIDAASVALTRLRDGERARGLLERARARGRTSPLMYRHVLDALVRIHEAAERWPEAREARKARVVLLADARARSFELAEAAALADRSGGRSDALADLEEARTIDPDDDALRDRLDTLLRGDPARREALWRSEATRATEPSRRAAAWSKAAQIAEETGAIDRAIGHLRSAIATAPEDDALADRLAVILATTARAAPPADVRDRIAVYTHAAERSTDKARRIAYLEKVAVLWEEVAFDHALAAGAYADILSLEPDRRSAILGLQRAAKRAGDAPGEARALEREAQAASDPRVADALNVRAATIVTAIDPERALSLVVDVLARDPKNDAARALEAQLHEAAERWEKADDALAARIEHAPDRATRVALWIARAEIQRTKLASPADALSSLRAARGLDPSHPALADAIVAAVEASGEPRALRSALLEMARDDASVIDRARRLVRAAEIDELVLQDDASAASAYAEMLAITPGETWLEDRLARIVGRQKRADPKDDTRPRVAARPERSTPRDTFDRARALIDGGDASSAIPLLEAILAADPRSAHALRTLEAIARKPYSPPLLANALEQESTAFQAESPKLGALWAEAALVEWALPETSSVEIYSRILAVAPHDRAALDALFRRALALARAGETDAKTIAARALSGLLAHAPDDSTRLAIVLARALLMDVNDGASIPNARLVLAEYREALRIDPRSPLAAAGTARLSAIVHDGEAIVAGAVARAELATEPRARAVLLVHAAGTLLGGDDPALGAREARRARALDLLEQALASDPGSVSAAGVLITLCLEDGQRDRLLRALRNALAEARSRDAIVAMGTELARVAVLAPADYALAVAALGRVRDVAPDHAPALFALANAYSAQEAWPEAADALEATVTHATDRVMKRRALFALADLYERIFHKPADVERVYRLALEQDPRDARAIRGLLPHLRAPDRIAQDGTAREIADLLERLAGAEEVPLKKSAALLELAEVRTALGERSAAEQALVEATAQSPSAEGLARIAAFAGASPSDYARALGALVTRAAQLGRPNAPALVALAELEVGTLGRFADGASHARTALALDATAHGARVIVARGLAHSGKAAEALATALPLIEPDATPLLSLRDPDAALAVLETSFFEERRDQEAFVVRELRAIAAGVDDATVVGLRARRVSAPDLAGSPGLLDAATLRARVLPPEGLHVLLDVAAAIQGVESKLLPDDLASFHPGPRDRVPAGHPLRIAFDRAARALGIETADLAVSDDIAFPSVTERATPLIVVPSALAAQPEPVQVAALSRALTRIALDLPWIARVPSHHVRAFLTAAARLAVPTYGTALHDAALEETVARYAGPIGQAVSRKQKRVLATLAPTLSASNGATAAEVDAFVLAEARAEFRVAFLLTADLLATLDELRAKDGAFAQATSVRGLTALAATLSHPIAGDTCRFAMTANATSLRRGLGTLWGGARP